ncbi:MAG: hypothetical protein ABS81_10935 [Pseudonocardia sp. SCN 72-86]|nr:MAG: hypothetical protein ABS81_10935 [Pseudonocardia sp. SCN 72-86]
MDRERAPGNRAMSYRQDMALMGTSRRWALTAVVILAVMVLPLAASRGWVAFATVTAISVITVTGLQVLMGTCGQVSVGQSAFMGVGAYLAGFAATVQGFPLLLAILFAGVGTTLVGLVFALPATRIHGFYLALTTIAAQFVFVFTVPRLPAEWFGGNTGLSLSAPSVFGVTLRTATQLYYLVIPIAIVLVVVASFVNHSQLGRQMVAVRENELAAGVNGVRVTRTKIIAFGIASFYAGTAGALLAFVTGIAHYEQFTLIESIWFLGYLIVGGLSRTLGAVIGTVLLCLVREWLHVLADSLGDRVDADVVFPMINVVFGVVILLVLLYQSRGLVHVYSTVMARARRWPL